MTFEETVGDSLRVFSADPMARGVVGGRIVAAHEEDIAAKVIKVLKEVYYYDDGSQVPDDLIADGVTLAIKRISEYRVGHVIDNLGNVTGFHAQDHVFFSRTSNGDVRVQVWSMRKPFTLLTTITINAHVWASVVTSVAYQGEAKKSYNEALDFHERR